MKVADLKEVAERQSFRPFTVRVNNGAQYTFTEPRSLGAPKDYHVVLYFGDTECVMIDTDSIAEIINR